MGDIIQIVVWVVVFAAVVLLFWRRGRKISQGK